MKRIDEKELKEIRGGISSGAVVLISAAVVFILGIFTGYSNPVGCNTK